MSATRPARRPVSGSARMGSGSALAPAGQRRPAARPRAGAGPAIFAPPLPRAAARCSPCARGLPRAVAAPVRSPGVVRHVSDEQRRVGGAQVSRHDGGGTLGQRR